MDVLPIELLLLIARECTYECSLLSIQFDYIVWSHFNFADAMIACMSRYIVKGSITCTDCNRYITDDDLGWRCHIPVASSFSRDELFTYMKLELQSGFECQQCIERCEYGTDEYDTDDY